MRKTTIILIILAVCWIGYLASPFYALYGMVSAFETRNADALTQGINFPRLRQSLTDQIMQAYIRRAGIHMSPLTQSIVGSALSIADPLVNRLVSPDALSSMMTSGWPPSVLAQAPPGTVGVSSRTLGTAWQIFMSSHYGFGQYEVPVPASFPRDRRFGLQFRISHWRWQLGGIVLPEPILDALADELIRITKLPARTP